MTEITTRLGYDSNTQLRFQSLACFVRNTQNKRVIQNNKEYISDLQFKRVSQRRIFYNSVNHSRFIFEIVECNNLLS